MKALRPYQQEAFDLVWGLVERKRENRALVVMATGLGKTVLAAALTRRWFARRTGRALFLAHTTDILRQARKEFIEALDPLVTTGILTSDESKRLDARVLFATFQSMQGRLDAFDSGSFGLVIVDEAHHGQAVTFKGVIEHFAPAFLFGMTATPDRLDKLDIREIFGSEVCSYPLQFGIQESWLSSVEYRLLTDNLSIHRLRELVREVEEGRRVSRKQIDATIFLPERTDRIVQIVKEAQALGKRTILFCRAIDHLEHVQRHFPEAVAYHSQIPFAELRRRFDAFHDGWIQTLLVVDKFNEGVDIPDAELIVFLRATDSKTLWLQQLGRGLRRVDGKTRVVVLDFVANCDRLLFMQETGLAVTIKTGEALPEAITVDTNLDIRFSEELRNLFNLLQFLEVGLYETYEEAREAVAKLDPPWEGDLSRWYRVNYRLDSRLPSAPHTVYNGKGWISWSHFCDRELYQTYEEARAAVAKLDPPWRQNLCSWYRGGYRGGHGGHYHLDPRLHSAPNLFYKGKGWVSWPHFCDRELYQTYEEARAAVAKLDPPWRINLGAWYRDTHKTDPRLPTTPDAVYKSKGWVSWPHLCDREPYSFEEARAAVARYNPPWKVDLKKWFLGKIYPLNRRFLSNPNISYQDTGWISWPHFCDRELYQTYEEARTAVLKLDPPSKGDLTSWYRAIRSLNPRLHSSPNKLYKDKGWVSWAHFCGREKT